MNGNHLHYGRDADVLYSPPFQMTLLEPLFWRPSWIPVINAYKEDTTESENQAHIISKMTWKGRFLFIVMLYKRRQDKNMLLDRYLKKQWIIVALYVEYRDCFRIIYYWSIKVYNPSENDQRNQLPPKTVSETLTEWILWYLGEWVGGWIWDQGG